jgi:hypothetical protein
LHDALINIKHYANTDHCTTLVFRCDRSIFLLEDIYYYYL